MKLPRPRYKGRADRSLTTSFLGLNLTEEHADGGGKMQFADTVNGGSGRFPFAASRCGRAAVRTYTNPQGMLGGDFLAVVADGKLYIDGEEIEGVTLSSGEKQIVQNGGIVYIFPDGVYYNTVNEEHGSLRDGEEGGTTEFAVFRLHVRDKETDDEFNIGRRSNTFTVEYTTDGDPITSYGVYMSSVEVVSTLPSSFVYKGGTSDDMYRKEGHYFYPLRGHKTGEDEQDRAIIAVDKWRELIPVYVEAYENVTSAKNLWTERHIVFKESDPTIVYVPDGNMDFFGTNISKKHGEYYGLGYSCTWYKRTLPVFDYVCVHENRLWGCRRGMSATSFDDVNEVYCSALGDFSDWTVGSTAGAAWTASVGQAGKFTGACSFGVPMFFKEDVAYSVTGSYVPFRLNKLSIDGVAENAERSLVQLDGALYYKARNWVCRYTSSSLRSASKELGPLVDGALTVIGRSRGKLYCDIGGVIYVYDPRHGVWYKEDALDLLAAEEYDGKLYLLTAAGDLLSVEEDADMAAAEPWSLTSHEIGYAYPNRKILHSLRVRIEAAAPPTVEVSFDGGAFATYGTVTLHGASGAASGSYLLSIRPRRCEKFKFRLSGTGPYKLTGITKEIGEAGR